MIIAKADPNAASFSGDQPLDVAEQRRNVYLVNYLYSVGARESTEAGFPFSPHSRASVARSIRTGDGNFSQYFQHQPSTGTQQRSVSGSVTGTDIVTNLNRSAFGDATTSPQNDQPHDVNASFSGRASDNSSDERSDDVDRLRAENKRLQTLVESQQAEIVSLRAQLGMRDVRERGDSSTSAQKFTRSLQLPNKSQKGDTGSRSLQATRLVEVASDLVMSCADPRL